MTVVYSDRVSAILENAVVIDGLGGSLVHPTPHVDNGTYEEYLVESGWTAMNGTLVSEPSYTPTFEEVLSAIYENLIHLELSPHAKLVEKSEDIISSKDKGKIGLIFGLQSASCVEQDRKRLRILHKLGLRILQLTYMERNFIGDGCLEPENRGLSHFGIQVVRECNRIGLIVDCSHVGVQSSIDAASYSDDPIVISHTAIREITDNPRCVTDEQLKAVANKGGVVGITPYAPFIRNDRAPTPEDYVDHIEYAINLIGIDCVGIATDVFDGKTTINWATPWYYPEVTRGSQYKSRRIDGIRHKSDLGNLIEILIDRGLNEKEILKLLGGNFLRVMQAVWK